jgi:phosphotransferase system IIB component
VNCIVESFYEMIWLYGGEANIFSMSCCNTSLISVKDRETTDNGIKAYLL